jgi:hypothetical protein
MGTAFKPYVCDHAGPAVGLGVPGGQGREIGVWTPPGCVQQNLARDFDSGVSLSWHRVAWLVWIPTPSDRSPDTQQGIRSTADG